MATFDYCGDVMRRLTNVLAIGLAVGLAATAAVAGPRIDRVRAQGLVHCGSFARPGLAIDVAEGEAAAADSVGQTPAPTPWHGLAVEICKAVAVAVLGSPEKIAFHTYEAADDFAALSDGEDDIAFLSAREMHMTGMTGRLVPGPAVYIESIAAMVPTAAGIRRLDDVDATKGVCFASGSPLEHILPGYFAGRKAAWLPMSFTEDGEMLDAYNVQRCHVLAGERTTLAMDALEPGVNQLHSLILPEAIARFPIMAATVDDDGQWSALTAWTIYTLLAGDRPATDWQVGGAAALPVVLSGSGLAKDWQAQVLHHVGSYAAILDRTVGDHSALKLPTGDNALPEQGGLLAAPMVE